MNTHLTEEQISRYIAGYATGELGRHIAGCAQCSAKVASFESIIGQFRGSAGDWAGRECRLPDIATLSGSFRRSRWRSLRWVAAAATLAAIVAAVPAFRKPVEPPIVGAVYDRAYVTESEQSRSDWQLLERVNAHLSQSAPASLQPLMEMLRNDSKNEGEIR